MKTPLLMAVLGASSLALAACDVHTSTYLYDDHPRRPVVVREEPVPVYGGPVYGGPVYAEPQPIIVRQAPPPPPVERVVAAPGPGYVWIPGYYDWAGNRWAWRSGHWERPPRQGAVWVPPRTVQRDRGEIEFRVGIWK
jgi:hypothetical protein